MIQKVLPVGPLQCNCQILVCRQTREVVLVDPGDEPKKIMSEIQKIETQLGQSLNVRALLHTHAHFDHIAATRSVKEAFQGVPQIYLHPEDEFIYNKLVEQGRMFGIPMEPPAKVDRHLQDEETLQFGTMKFSVIHTPGHSPGGVCYRLHEDSSAQVPEMVMTGDTLFKESVGRSDLWGGDEVVLAKSIRERLYSLDDDTLAWPGHGPQTQIGLEKRQNPFVRG
jgi:hydroxyacylglutathione hydrolase